MLSFGLDEIQVIQRIARDAASGATFVSRLQTVMEQLELLVPVSSLSVFAIDLEAPEALTPSHGFFKNRDLGALLAYATHYRLVDPMAHGIVEATGQPLLLSDCVLAKDFGGDPFTGEYLPDVNVHHIMGIASRMPDGVRLAVALHRDRRLGDFTAKEREALRLVAPDITRAAFGSLLQEKVQRLAAGSDAAASSGAVVFDARGDIVHADPTALRLLQRIEPPQAGEPTAAEALSVDVRRLVDPAPVEGMTIERVLRLAGGGYLRTRSSPIEARPGTNVVCTLEVLRPGTPDYVDAVARQARLTAREVTVARLAIQGLGNRHIAFELGIAAPTVGVYLSSIYRKVGVTDRVELTRLMHGGG